MDYGPAPEDPREALAWLDKHHRRFGHFINGAWHPPIEKKYFDTTDPSTTEKLADIAQGSAQDIDDAVKAARAALPAWQSLTPHARARYLYALARQIQKHSRRLAVLETLDNGKPIRESRDIDIPLVARHFYHHAGWAQLLPQEFPDQEACGVVGQIIPWNFPLLMLAWKIAPALATGNTVVLKPAEFTPLTALAFAEICQEIDLPAGVVNIVTGDGTTGEALVAHPEVDKIAFTGSTEVGRAIRKATASSHKKLSLELGGKSPFIIFEDADLDSAVEGLVDGIWFNQGQVCCAGSRLLMQESIAEPLIAKICDRMNTLRVGPPLDKSIDIGAIIARVQLDRIQRLVDQGVAEGATCWQPNIPMPSRGLYFPPTLLSNVHPTSIVSQQEIFGPVLAAMTFRTPSRSRRACQQHGLRSRRLRLERKHQRQPPRRLSNQSRRSLGQLHQSFRRQLRLRRLPRKRLRSRRRPRRPPGISRAHLVQTRAATPPAPASDRPTAATNRGIRRRIHCNSANRPHRKTLHRRQASPPRLRLQHPRPRPRRPPTRRSPARQSQRHSQRRRSRSQSHRLAQVHRPHPRPSPLLPSRKSQPTPR